MKREAAIGGSEDIDAIRERLSLFLARNPESAYAREDDRAHIQKPWGDSSLELRVGEDDSSLMDALNSLRLPPRFTAIWHLDTRDFEVIWGAVPDTYHELQSRQFDFSFGGNTYNCTFAPASTRLLELAKAARPVSPSTLTNHRNLTSIQVFAMLSEIRPGDAPAATVTSFWIRAIDVDENEMANLARHLNFYMRYFDQQSPHILLHEEAAPQSLAAPIRYPFGDFPRTILGREIDPYLLSLWQSSVNSPDPFRRFLYLYQILEYAAFYYVQTSLRNEVRKAVSSPDVLSRLDLVLTEVIDALAEHRMNPDEQIRSVVRESADPLVIWAMMEPKMDFFSSPTQFDGGFSIESIVKQGWTADDFRSAWIPIFPDTVRKLRNALVHARESRMGAGIAPTRSNYNKIVPWLPPLSVCAMQIMLYGSAA